MRVARGDSTIRVTILGDARKLTGALGEVDRSMGGLLASAGRVLVAGVVVQKGFELVGSALENTDRVSDATTRLNLQIGELNTDTLTDAAYNFTQLGLSAPDMLELAANFADLATAATDLSDADIARMAPDIASVAAAIELLGGGPATQSVEQIGKFVAGARGAAEAGKALGLEFDKDSTAAERFALVMEALGPKVGAVTGANAGLEEKQAAIGAQWENLTTKIGPPLESFLSDVLGFVNDQVDAIPGAIDGWNSLGLAIDKMLRDVLGPLATARDAVEDLLGLFGRLRSANVGHDPIGDFFFGGSSEHELTRAVERNRARNGQGSP